MATPLVAGLRAPLGHRILRLPCRHCLHEARSIRFSAIRFSSTAARPEKQNAAVSPKEFALTKKSLYPERLLIYNAGTGKTAWIGFTKLGTVIFLAFGCLVIAPGIFSDPSAPSWAGPAALLLTPLPLLITAAATSPFVNSVYLHVPAYARASQQLLTRFAAAPPPETRLDFVTVRLSGAQKTTGCTLGELRALTSSGSASSSSSLPPWRRWGLANVERVVAPPSSATTTTGKKKKAGTTREKSSPFTRFLGLLFEPRRRFYVDPAPAASLRSRAPGVMEMVMKAIERNGERQQQKRGN